MAIEVPDGSLYYWCFEQGLKHIPLEDVEAAVRACGKQLRDKDVRNYREGWFRSDLNDSNAPDNVWLLYNRKHPSPPSSSFLTTPYRSYPVHPYLGFQEIGNRWVPCNADNKPMQKWGGEECMSLADARAWPGQVYLAETLKGTRYIVIDCDGDHDPTLDMETIRFLSRFKDMTHCLRKPKAICEYEGYEDTGIEDPASFHLTFATDRVIPTMHLQRLGVPIDILGNEKNQLRYRKNKIWNGLEPIPMTTEIWNEIRRFVQRRKTDG